MRTLLLYAILAAPVTAAAVEAPAPPVIAVPQAVTGTAPAAPAAPVIQTETAPASIKLTAKDPREALKAAIWPGLLLHGWGHRAAGDQDTFLNLAGGELFSVVMLGFGLAEALGPDIKDETKSTSQSVAAAGAVFFAATWIWDLAGAQAAARRYNARLSLGLAPQDGAPQLALTTRF
jgi:hypothetical protein